jgi:hypothetical protein
MKALGSLLVKYFILKIIIEDFDLYTRIGYFDYYYFFGRIMGYESYKPSW